MRLYLHFSYFICDFFNTFANALTTSKWPKLDATQREVA